MAEASPSERVLVTGASGFLAAHVIKQLQEQGYQVRGTVRNLENEEKLKHIKELVPDAAHPVELVQTDNTKEDGWKSAVEGCTYVIHTASPLPINSPADENVVIAPAVEGVKNVLKAVKEAGGVKRVVLTSAGLAIIGYMRGGEFSEKDWPENEDQLDAYAKSKTKAEKEAWEFVKNLEDGDKFELAVIHPTAMLGPVLHSQMGTSMEIMKRILTRNPPLIPKLNIPAVDVRDVAKAHIIAMTEPEAAGNRHILTTENIWWSEIAGYVAEEFKPQGYKIASVSCPKFGIQLAAIFDKDVKAILPNWNTITTLNNTRMKEVLKIEEPISLKTSVIDMAYSMIENGFVKKTAKYRGRNWKEIFEKEKAEKEQAKSEKVQAKAEKLAAKRASKKVKVKAEVTNENGDAVKENGDAAATEGGEEKKDEVKEEEKKEDEEPKKEEEKAETKEDAKTEETKDEGKTDETKDEGKTEETADEAKTDETEEKKEETKEEQAAEPETAKEEAPAEEKLAPAEEETPAPAEEETSAPAEEEPAQEGGAEDSSETKEEDKPAEDSTVTEEKKDEEKKDDDKEDAKQDESAGGES